MLVLTPGDPAPWFIAPTSSRPDFDFSTAAGRYVALAFVASSVSEPGQVLLEALRKGRKLFNDERLAFFGVTADPQDQALARVQDEGYGVRWFYDPDRRIAAMYGAAGGDGEAPALWLILDPSLRVIAVGPMSAVDQLLIIGAGLPPVDNHAGVAVTAPVLLVPRVFEPEFCRHLISVYESQGGAPSGFMTEEGGKTVRKFDNAHKRRSDCIIEDEALRAACRGRIHRRLAPEIAKAFQFTATRMERYIIACYRSDEGGLFRPHRDNTTKGTAHRRFAITLNLNAEDYDGGELCFPEYGPRTYRAPTGGAVVFSCTLLHEALPVTRGVRYAFLPFLYDEAAASLREQNNRHLDPAVGEYSKNS